MIKNGPKRSINDYIKELIGPLSLWNQRNQQYGITEEAPTRLHIHFILLIQQIQASNSVPCQPTKNLVLSEQHKEWSIYETLTAGDPSEMPQAKYKNAQPFILESPITQCSVILTSCQLTKLLTSLSSV